MSTAAEEPSEPIDWEGFMSGIESLDRITSQIGAGSVRLPNDDDIGDLEARVTVLSDAETEMEKIAALKDLTRWLGQWQF